jgi:serine phosphatase RsbU (regulator of sigma subunit)
VQALHQDAGNSQDDGMDISICTIDRKNNRISFAGANRPCFITRENRLEEIRGDIFSIGGMFGKKEVSFSQKIFPLNEISCLYLFTDGYADQPGGEKKKKFQEKNLERLFSAFQMNTMYEQAKILSSTITEWKGKNDQLDDMLVIGIKI